MYCDVGALCCVVGEVCEVDLVIKKDTSIQTMIYPLKNLAISVRFLKLGLMFKNVK